MIKDGQKSGQAMIKVIKNQINDNNPPETKQAYFRLLGEGISEQNVYIYLAQALAYEIFDMLKKQRPFDNERYVKLLSQLPHLN